MSKKEELKMLFDFLIEMLKEDTVESVEPKKELLTEEVKEEKEEKTPFDFDHVLNLMKKVDSLHDEKSKINSVVNQSKRMLETELKKVKENYEKSLTMEKNVLEQSIEENPSVEIDDVKGTVAIIGEELKK